MKEITTTNLADFGYSEMKELSKILNAWMANGLPEDFEGSGVHPMFNRNSVHVFLTNDEFQACRMNGDELETWYYCFNCGHEGFKEECQLNEDGCSECRPQEEDA